MEKFMDERERLACVGWIRKYLSDMTRKQADSYVLKHMFQRMTGIYSSDTEFQEVMRECGFEPLESTKSVFEVKVDSLVIKNYYKN
ncbi:hypothetical protein D6855_07220 [Butyrivibrio sp. CB08]|nr:hypothetical protein D6855_07220 [Butyrivibrio sp. CB08]